MRAVLAMCVALWSGAAGAGVVAEADVRPGVVIQLHDDVGPCVGAARLAVYVDGSQRIPGCWVMGGEMVGIAFLDGDTGRIPRAALRAPAVL